MKKNGSHKIIKTSKEKIPPAPFSHGTNLQQSELARMDSNESGRPLVRPPDRSVTVNKTVIDKPNSAYGLGESTRPIDKGFRKSTTLGDSLKVSKPGQPKDTP